MAALAGADALAAVGRTATVPWSGEGAGERRDRAASQQGEHVRDAGRDRDHHHARDRGDRHPDQP